MFLRPIVKRFFTHSFSMPRHSHIEYKVDAYRSVHLTPTSKILEPEFKDYLNDIVKKQMDGNRLSQISQQTNAVWVHLTGDNLGLISYLCSNGFSIHHGAGQGVTLWRWISSQKDLVAPFCNFIVSAGAVLLKDDRIFLVQEKSGPRKGHYGIPGGRADSGETISSCSERQLLEQANIKAKFDYILHFRELQKTAYGAMDIYFACMMKHDESSFQNIRICPRQLSDYKWVHLSEYEQFCQKHSTGTQYQLSKYITKLFKSGYDFKTRLPNQTTVETYVASFDRVERTIVQHGMVEGCKIDKIYSK